MAANYNFAKAIGEFVLLWLHGRRLGIYGDGQSTTNSSLVLDRVTVGNTRTGANSLKGIATSLSGAGAVTLAGTLVGDTVELVMDMSSDSDVTSSFESTISVAGQIQQLTSTSGHTCLFFVNPQAAA
jgi:hypothetical protein